MYEALKGVTGVSVIKALLREVWGRVRKTSERWGNIQRLAKVEAITTLL